MDEDFIEFFKELCFEIFGRVNLDSLNFFHYDFYISGRCWYKTYKLMFCFDKDVDAYYFHLETPIRGFNVDFPGITLPELPGVDFMMGVYVVDLNNPESIASCKKFVEKWVGSF